MVDVAAAVDDGFLEQLRVGKGERRVISLQERGEVLEALVGNSYQVSAGGSLSNTLVALARLGSAEDELRASGALRIGMAAVAGGDPQGAFHRAQLAAAGVYVLFANREEASALLGQDVSAEEAALALGPHCGLVAVTDGARGSCLSAMGRLQVVPPFWAPDQPVDTCGAGDAYAAGLLYARLSGLDPAGMGAAAARAASAAIARRGAAISAADASKVVAAVADRRVRGRGGAASWALPLGGVVEARV
ncbi:hypothetical protein WJX81_000167 [Elliptochloris bilobata]|uniref:Carbohydrate kinase PfkB domain-containing protein n=1 Tax=Elliptochloris bilobata TaxID=381761 RepID=A0AAW1RDM9_9CHLO